MSKVFPCTGELLKGRSAALTLTSGAGGRKGDGPAAGNRRPARSSATALATARATLRTSSGTA